MNEAELDTTQLDFEQKVDLLEDTLPNPVREFLHSKERDAISLTLTRKYGLHVDAAAAFERAYLYMLLGVHSPEDFAEDLREAGISAQIIQGLATDLNELVFIPLRRKEMASPISGYAAAEPTSHTPTASGVPMPQVGGPSVPVKTGPLSNSLPQNLIANPPRLVPATQPVVRTMAHDMDVLQHPEMAGQVTPARSFQTASIPYTAAPMVPPASVSVPPQVHEAAARITPPPMNLPGSQPPAPVPRTPIVKEYVGDPYREPIE